MSQLADNLRLKFRRDRGKFDVRQRAGGPAEMENSLKSLSVCCRVVSGRTLLSFALGVLCICAVGCERSGPVTDADAEHEANYQRAKTAYERQDFEAASESYKKALEVNPEFAQAHLELGLLCDDKLGDPVSAIYHYRRYLELRPDSDKKQLVEDFIERARLSLAAKLPQSPIVDPSELTRLQNENAGLLRENAMLRSRIAELEKAAGRTVVADGGTPAAPDSATGSMSPPPAAAPPLTATGTVPTSGASEAVTAETSKARVHVVQKGDTLYSLALRYYGTRAGWERIYQANRSGLSSKDQLKVGQQLVIP